MYTSVVALILFVHYISRLMQHHSMKYFDNLHTITRHYLRLHLINKYMVLLPPQSPNNNHEPTCSCNSASIRYSTCAPSLISVVGNFVVGFPKAISGGNINFSLSFFDEEVMASFKLATLLSHSSSIHKYHCCIVCTIRCRTTRYMYYV